MKQQPNKQHGAQPVRPHTTFSAFIAQARREQRLVLQPRMGVGSLEGMCEGLLAVRECDALTVGTITVDSFTRVRDYAAAERAMADGHALNGFPLVTHDPDAIRRMLGRVRSPDFCVQVRHGAPLSCDIVTQMLDVGLDATEGGPVSYCLPYGRVPLRQTIDEWARACDLLAASRTPEFEPHLETFAGCLLGQLCPPDLLVALSVMEGLFFRQHGVRSISLSYAQQTNAEQDAEAAHALQSLARQFMPDDDWHVVVYTYMGLFPLTAAGATALPQDSVRLVTGTGAARLIVKTPTEATRLPTVEENAGALGTAADSPVDGRFAPSPTDTAVLSSAQALVREPVTGRPSRQPGSRTKGGRGEQSPARGVLRSQGAPHPGGARVALFLTAPRESVRRPDDSRKLRPASRRQAHASTTSCRDTRLRLRAAADRAVQRRSPLSLAGRLPDRKQSDQGT